LSEGREERSLRQDGTRPLSASRTGVSCDDASEWQVTVCDPIWHVSSRSGEAFLARDVIYTSCAYATMSVSVCLSVTEVNWRIIVNLGFKF